MTIYLFYCLVVETSLSRLLPVFQPLSAICGIKTHYKFSQIIKVATRGQAILDKIWTNMNMVYSKSVTVAELGNSEHNMVLLKSSSKMTLDTGNMTRLHIKSMCTKEKATFEFALSLIKWEPLYRLDSCNEKYVYYQTVIDNAFHPR